MGYLCVGVWPGANVTGDKHDHQHNSILVVLVLAFGFTNTRVCMANGLVPHLLLRAPWASSCVFLCLLHASTALPTKLGYMGWLGSHGMPFLILDI